MKKNLIYIFSFGVLALGACTKQLDEYNPGGTTAQSLFTTPEGLEAAVNGAYTYNRNLYGKEEGYALLEMGTDIWTNAANNGSTGSNGIFPQPPLTTYQGLIADNTWIKTRLWQPCYAAINLCNQALKYIEAVGLTAARKPVLEAELRFLRAWYYWHLTESFGEVHFTLEPTEGMITTANRTSVEVIYEQIIADLTYAVSSLPLTTSDYGRITRPAAEAFLARIYLTRGKDREAANFAVKVINEYTGNNITLLSDYARLWDMNNQRNSEVLWAVNYSTNLTYNAGSNLGHMLFLMEYNTQPGMMRDVANGYAYVRYMPTLFLLNLFDEGVDARFNTSFKTTWYANSSARPEGMDLGDTAVFCTKYPVDEAIRASRNYKIYDVNDIYNVNGQPKDRFHYISLKKFDDPTRASATETQSSRDVFLIRLSEMYLIAAEAQLHMGRQDSAAYFINIIRRRAAVPGRESAMEISPAQITTDFILDERAREFAGEQLRWFDLKRTGKLIERVKLHNPDAAPYIRDFHIRRPIPQSELDAVTNKGEFWQNDGY